MHHRNAVSVLPLPVGAVMRVDSPPAIAGQPCRCGRVGAAKAEENHDATGAWKRVRTLAAIGRIMLRMFVQPSAVPRADAHGEARHTRWVMLLKD
jgi:hypothetical protein